MSPLVWDLAHIGQQEELWLLRGGDPNRPGMLPPAVEGLYDAFEHSRASRVDLPLLSPKRAHSYCRTVRSAALDALDALPDDDGEFVFGMVVSHENQHDETMLQALNLRTGAPLLPDTVTLPAGRPGLAGTSVLVPAGPFVLGVDAASEPYSLDNERPAHVVDLPAFRIGRVPVTNGEWQHFIDDGGYNEPRWWSTRGWQHRQTAGLTAPQFWSFRRPHAHPLRPRRRHSTRRAGAARHLLRGRGLRGLGRRPVAHRGGMGEGLRLGPGDRHPAPLPVGSRGAVGSPRQPRWQLAASGAGRRLPGRRFGLRGRADARRRLGVDQLTAAALARVRPDDLRAILAAVLRRRLPGAAGRIVGGGVRDPAAQLPQLGPPVPPADLLRRPVGCGTSDVPSSRLARARGHDLLAGARPAAFVCGYSRTPRAGRSTA